LEGQASVIPFPSWDPLRLRRFVAKYFDTRAMTDVLLCLRRSYEAFNLKDTGIARRDYPVCGSGHGERQRM